MKKADNENTGKRIALGLTLGAGFGLVVGQMFDVMVFGLPIGAGLGLVVALLIEAHSGKSNDSDK